MDGKRMRHTDRGKRRRLGGDIGKPVAVGAQRRLLEARLSDHIRDFGDLDRAYPRRREPETETDDRENWKCAQCSIDKFDARYDRMDSRIPIASGGERILRGEGAPGGNAWAGIWICERKLAITREHGLQST